MIRRRAFSLIEVLFAVAFLIMVGLAMTALNTAALKVIVNNEITTTASVLNDEALAYVALARKAGVDEFSELMKAAGCDDIGCFVNCPTSLGSGCTLEKSPAPVTLGRSKLSFKRELLIRLPSSGGMTVKATVRWGTGIKNQATAYRFLD